MADEKLISALRQWVKETAAMIRDDEKQARLFAPGGDKEYLASAGGRGAQLQAFIAFMNGYMGDGGFMSHDDLRRLLGWLEEGKPAVICPRCNSTNIDQEEDGNGVVTLVMCDDCGYVIFIQDGDEEDESEYSPGYCGHGPGEYYCGHPNCRGSGREPSTPPALISR